jgi:hypothetical protein
MRIAARSSRRAERVHGSMSASIASNHRRVRKRLTDKRLFRCEECDGGWNFIDSTAYARSRRRRHRAAGGAD